MTSGIIRSAIAAGEFCVYYQPRFSVTTRLPGAAEALLRWATRPDISPDVFVPEMERNGHIEAATLFITESVCKHIRYLQSSLGFSPKIAINIPPALLCDNKFAGRLRALVDSYEVPPNLIEIEITESTLAHDFASVVNSATLLRTDGHDIALDDFGTGFSGLRYLDLVPASVIKIDRHFVSGLGSRKTCDMIVAAVAQMARDSGMITVAEGVETQSQLDHIARLGYNEAQGFLLGMPMPFDEFFTFLADPAGTGDCRSRQEARELQEAMTAQPHIHFPVGC